VIEKPSELELSDFELVTDDDEEPAARLVLAAWPGFVARASTPATTRPVAARTASARLTPPARRLADSIRDN